MYICIYIYTYIDHFLYALSIWFCIWRQDIFTWIATYLPRTTATIPDSRTVVIDVTRYLFSILVTFSLLLYWYSATNCTYICICVPYFICCIRISYWNVNICFVITHYHFCNSAAWIACVYYEGFHVCEINDLYIHIYKHYHHHHHIISTIIKIFYINIFVHLITTVKCTHVYTTDSSITDNFHVDAGHLSFIFCTVIFNQ